MFISLFESKASEEINHVYGYLLPVPPSLLIVELKKCQGAISLTSACDSQDARAAFTAYGCGERLPSHNSWGRMGNLLCISAKFNYYRFHVNCIVEPVDRSSLLRGWCDTPLTPQLRPRQIDNRH